MNCESKLHGVVPHMEAKSWHTKSFTPNHAHQFNLLRLQLRIRTLYKLISKTKEIIWVSILGYWYWLNKTPEEHSLYLDCLIDWREPFSDKIEEDPTKTTKWDLMFQRRGGRSGRLLDRPKNWRPATIMAIGERKTRQRKRRCGRQLGWEKRLQISRTTAPEHIPCKLAG